MFGELVGEMNIWPQWLDTANNSPKSNVE